MVGKEDCCRTSGSLKNLEKQPIDYQWIIDYGSVGGRERHKLETRAYVVYTSRRLFYHLRRYLILVSWN